MLTDYDLPPALEADLVALGQCLLAGTAPPTALVAACVARLDGLPAAQVVTASVRIRNALCCFYYPRNPEQDRRRICGVLATMPMLAQVLILHRDGHVREAALNALVTVPRSPFMLAALAMRLNDWAGPVRTAAAWCAGRLFAQVAPDVAVAMGLALRAGWQDWMRWAPAQAACMDQLFARPAVRVQLVARFATACDGALAVTLRSFLRTPLLDAALPMLAAMARQAGVRATALQVLLWGQARWKTGTRREWVNKSLGLDRPVPELARRDVRQPVDRNALIAMALQDRSALVRRTALRALAQCWRDFPGLATILPALEADPSPTVQRWAGYLRPERESGL
ncbi:hypothetical protein HNW77_16550 [Komagataeibacter sp. AV436]|uniref:HEAT repeat domain-containing protein n=1 Tax=Komagataeibacter melomenusus TaxID=2766578 RepID=A0ABX2AKD6_9PROT|nr:hypothetical protein [Komagataeibacter melomenusus]MBV1832117.1 hypothetical protein [Komagataeibacter melomenusus]NPC67952.1 hypothetical protein [Komagataeibacter melomenusus]